MTGEVKIVTEPTVYVLGRQAVDDNELTRFLAAHGVAWETDTEVAAEALAETAGRVCYMSFARPRPGGNGAYLRHVKEAGHGSVLEHAAWNLLVTGVSRSLTHELVRHRAGFAYSQLSQRYADESDAGFVEPGAVGACRSYLEGYLEGSGTGSIAELLGREEGHPAEAADVARVVSLWDAHMRDSRDRYRAMSGALSRLAESAAAAALTGKAFEGPTEARKFARQAARSVLPNATETKIFVTLNARAARHFLELRGSRHADPEIRLLANKVLDALQGEAPNLFGDYGRTPLGDGTCEIATQYRKV